MKQIYTILLASLIAGLLCSAFLTACSGPSDTAGVIAVVNGDVITMRELQARYDLDNLTWSENRLPQAEDLQRQYGESLSSLIINLLVMQELSKRDLAVTDEEMSLAELEIRKDYAEGEFETILEDDAIDLEMWRYFLRQRLSVQKFIQTVLRPGIKVSPEECTAFYNDNVDKFKQPARDHFLIVESVDKDALNSALAGYKENGKTDSFAGYDSNIRVREVRMRDDRLSPQWSRELKVLKKGEASLIKPGEEGFQFIIFIGHQEESVLALAQAYPLVEKELVEQKVETFFNEWLTQRVEKSDIEVSTHLAEVWLGNPGGLARSGNASTECDISSYYDVDMPYNYDDDINRDPFATEEDIELFHQESSP